MHRFFAQDISGEQIIIRDRELVHQLARVLRMKKGESIIVFDGFGKEFEVMLEQISEKQIVGRVTKMRECDTELTQEISLYQAIPKQLEKFEFVLQKCTELGVRHFYPLITARTEGAFRKRERLEKIIQEATEQCGGCTIPVLHNPVNLFDIGDRTSINILAYEKEEKCTLGDILPKATQAKKINLFIGPEGGFADEEIIACRKKEFFIVSLGKRVLRTETAAMALVSALTLWK